MRAGPSCSASPGLLHFSLALLFKPVSTPSTSFIYYRWAISIILLACMFIKLLYFYVGRNNTIKQKLLSFWRKIYAISFYEVELTSWCRVLRQSHHCNVSVREEVGDWEWKWMWMSVVRQVEIKPEDANGLGRCLSCDFHCCKKAPCPWQLL